VTWRECCCVAWRGDTNTGGARTSGGAPRGKVSDHRFLSNAFAGKALRADNPRLGAQFSEMDLSASSPREHRGAVEQPHHSIAVSCVVSLLPYAERNR
jgi:hypothetical protein